MKQLQTNLGKVIRNYPGKGKALALPVLLPTCNHLPYVFIFPDFFFFFYSKDTQHQKKSVKKSSSPFTFSWTSDILRLCGVTVVTELKGNSRAVNVQAAMLWLQLKALLVDKISNKIRLVCPRQALTKKKKLREWKLRLTLELIFKIEIGHPLKRKILIYILYTL